jgi:hypothetical protein
MLGFLGQTLPRRRPWWRASGPAVGYAVGPSLLSRHSWYQCELCVVPGLARACILPSFLIQHVLGMIPEKRCINTAIVG